MMDASVILTKNTVLHKIRDMFMQLQSDMQDQSDLFGQEALHTPPKISRGENYLGLPYIILDYPRVFREGNIFAIRSMFWWGHYFSSTLHLGGLYKLQAQEKVALHYEALSREGYYISVHEDQWLHQFEPEVYLPVSKLSREDFIRQCNQFDHLKIGMTYPLEEGPSAAASLLNSWKFLLGTVTA